ncbi:hypothetical protein HDU97_002715 [Phlyctochytrium planicorne]|nr:hypothetical protein HDU97_002715 [Phlyctochytrium planicorne]
MDFINNLQQRINQAISPTNPSPYQQQQQQQHLAYGQQPLTYGTPYAAHPSYTGGVSARYGTPPSPYGQTNTFAAQPQSLYGQNQYVQPQPAGYGYGPIPVAGQPPLTPIASPHSHLSPASPSSSSTKGGQWMCRNPKHHIRAHYFNSSTTHDGFISYRVGTDAATASKFQTKLEERGHAVFLDSGCLPFGQDWEEGFLQGLQTSRHIFYLISEASLKIMKDKLAKGERDNVLIEMEKGLDWHNEGKVIAVPIFVSTYNPVTGVKHLDFRIIEEIGAGDVKNVASGRRVKDTLNAMMKLNGVVHTSIHMTGQEIFLNFLDRNYQASHPYVSREILTHPTMEQAEFHIRTYQLSINSGMEGSSRLDPVKAALEALAKDEISSHGNILKVDLSLAMIIAFIGEVQRLQGLHKDARASFEEALRIMFGNFGASIVPDPIVLKKEAIIVSLFAMLCYNEDKFDECAALCKRGLLLYENMHGTRLHEDAHITLFLLAMSNTQLKKFDESVEYFEDCYLVCEASMAKNGASDPPMNLILLELAKCETERENWADAEDYAKQARDCVPPPTEAMRGLATVAHQASALLIDMERKKNKKRLSEPAASVAPPVPSTAPVPNGSPASPAFTPPSISPAAVAPSAEPGPSSEEFDHSITSTLANLALTGSKANTTTATPLSPTSKEKAQGWEQELRQKMENLIAMVGKIPLDESKQFEAEEVAANMDRMMKAVGVRYGVKLV